MHNLTHSTIWIGEEFTHNLVVILGYRSSLLVRAILLNLHHNVLFETLNSVVERKVG